MNEKLIPYLSPTAQEAFSFLKATGMDEDLAFALTELHIPEENLWELPEVSNGPIVREDLDTD